MAQLGGRAFVPQFQRAIGQGFTPAYGGYLMSGGQVGGTDGDSTFRSYLANLPGTTNQAVNWQRALEASGGLQPGFATQRTSYPRWK